MYIFIKNDSFSVTSKLIWLVLKVKFKNIED